MLFALHDDAIRRQAEDYELETDEQGRIRIGYIYLDIWYRRGPRPGYAHMSFTAATKDMSRLFVASASIRDVFTGLAASAGAACCVLYREYDGDEICWLNGGPIAEPLYQDRFPDLAALAATWPDAG